MQWQAFYCTMDGKKSKGANGMYSKLRIDGIGGGHVQGIAIDRERRYVY